MDNLTFEPDEELKRFFLEYDRTDGRMDESPEQKARALRNPKARIKLNRLSHQRHIMRLTQFELAASTGISKRWIAAIEGGRSEPSVYIALVIAQALECKMEDLFRIEQPMPLDPPDRSQWTVVRS